MKLRVRNEDEFNKLIEERSLLLSRTIVNAIIKNLDTTKRHIYILSIIYTDTKEVKDITLEREWFKNALEENLENFINVEDYDQCIKIREAIKYLTLHEQKQPQENV
jgi:hypothetical protein